MTNQSIRAAFERIWQHTIARLGDKADINHNHNDIYYTETEVDEQIDTLADSINPIVATAGTGAAYTATVPGITTLTAGVSFIMIPHTVSTSTQPTLNVNGLGAKKILRRTTAVATGSQPGASTGWLLSNYPFRVIYDGTTWIVEGQPKPAASDISGTLSIDKGGTGATTAAAALTNLGVTATADELNKLDGVTTTTTELNYVNGVTSAIQTQLDDKLSTSGLTTAPAFVELSERIESSASNYGIVAGESNGWRYKIFPDQSIILTTRRAMTASASTEYGSYLQRSVRLSIALPTEYPVYDGVVTGVVAASNGWIVAGDVDTSNNTVGFRVVQIINTSSTFNEDVTVEIKVEGTLIAPESTGTTVDTSGTAISSFEIWTEPSRNMKVTYAATRTSATAATVKLTYTYTMNGSSGYTAYAQSVTPTINGSAKSATTLKSTSDSSSWYGSPIVKTVSYSITGLSASTTSIPLSCKFTSTDGADADVTKTGTIKLGLYS